MLTNEVGSTVCITYDTCIHIGRLRSLVPQNGHSPQTTDIGEMAGIRSLTRSIPVIALMALIDTVEPSREQKVLSSDTHQTLTISFDAFGHNFAVKNVLINTLIFPRAF